MSLWLQGVPAQMLLPAAVLCGVMFTILAAIGVVLASHTLRRVVRYARITAREEGWGGRSHPNQLVGETSEAVLTALLRAVASGRDRDSTVTQDTPSSSAPKAAVRDR